MTIEKVKECFITARKDEEKGKKHKGLLITKPDENLAKSYVQKAEDSLELCEMYKKIRFDYKIPEEWYYSLYYCALAILSKIGVDSRSQRCTAIFLKYIREKDIIEYDNEFIDRIIVHKEKDSESDVDEREKARYGPTTKMEEVMEKYDEMISLCKKAISQCREIVFSDEQLILPEELVN